jgi:hypothetical protein
MHFIVSLCEIFCKLRLDVTSLPKWWRSPADGSRTGRWVPARAQVELRELFWRSCQWHGQEAPGEGWSWWPLPRAAGPADSPEGLMGRNPRGCGRAGRGLGTASTTQSERRRMTELAP